MLNVLRCHVTYQGQVVTNAEARCNKSLRPRKPQGSLGRTAQDVHLDSNTAPELWKPWGLEPLDFRTVFTLKQYALLASNRCVSDSQRTKLCSVFHLTLFYNLVIIYSQCALLWHIHGERGRGREREFAFVYNICMCTWSSVRTCVLCRSMRVNVC